MKYTIPAPPLSQLEASRMRVAELEVELEAHRQRLNDVLLAMHQLRQSCHKWRQRASVWFGVFWLSVTVVACAEIFRALYGQQ